MKSFADGPAEADCIVDFSHHSCTAELLDYAIGHRLPVVLATTGQTEKEKQMMLMLLDETDEDDRRFKRRCEQKQKKRETEKKIANLCRILEREKGDVRGFLLALGYHTPEAVWARLQKEFLHVGADRPSRGEPSEGWKRTHVGYRQFCRPDGVGDPENRYDPVRVFFAGRESKPTNRKGI